MDMINRKMIFKFLRYTVILLTIAFAHSIYATPFSWGKDDGGDPIKPLRWPVGSTINIFVEADPDTNPPDRSALLKEGMDRWISILAARGITLTVTVGAIPNPAPAGSNINADWEPSGTTLEGKTLGTSAGQVSGIGTCSGAGMDLTGGEINMLDSLPAGNAGEQEQIRGLGQHEITHLLGLDDDSDGEVTNHLQDTNSNSYNATDLAEINTLYPVQGQQAPRAQGQAQQGTGENESSYNYNFNFEGLPGDHVPLIVLDIDPSVIQSINVPPGWLVLNPADPGHLNPANPFFQGSNVDGAPAQPVSSPNYQAPVVLRAQSSLDALMEGNPQLGFSVESQNAQLGLIRVWAGGDDIQLIVGPVPIESTTIPMFGISALIWLGLLLIAIFELRIRAKACTE